MARQTTERRKSPRIDARLALQVDRDRKPGGDRPVSSESLDLSTGGISCLVRSFMAPLTRIGLTLLLPSFGRQGKKTQVINCEGVVVRCQNDGMEEGCWEMACCFTDVKQPDRLLIEEYIGWRLMRDMIDERLTQP